MNTRENYPGIYLMVSELDGVHYVGGSTNYRDRWNKHRTAIKKGRSPYTKEFQAARLAEKLTFFLLEKLPKNCKKTHLYKREQYWQDLFPNRCNKCLSVTTKGTKLSPEACKKISQRMMGNTHGIGSPGFSGQHHSIGTIKKFRERMLGNQYSRRKQTPEHIEKRLKGLRVYWAKRRKEKENI